MWSVGVIFFQMLYGRKVSRCCAVFALINVVKLLKAILIKRLQVERMSSSYPDECGNNYLDRTIQNPINTNPGLPACKSYSLPW